MSYYVIARNDVNSKWQIVATDLSTPEAALKRYASELSWYGKCNCELVKSQWVHVNSTLYLGDPFVKDTEYVIHEDISITINKAEKS